MVLGGREGKGVSLMVVIRGNTMVSRLRCTTILVRERSGEKGTGREELSKPLVGDPQGSFPLLSPFLDYLCAGKGCWCAMESR